MCAQTHGNLDMGRELREIFYDTQTAAVVPLPLVLSILRSEELWISYLFPWIDDPGEFFRLSFLW